MSMIDFDDSSLELRFDHGRYGLSARRLWEHTELGQINVFSQDISAKQELNDAAVFIDVVNVDADTFLLTGLTLADLREWRIPRNDRVSFEALLNQLDQTSEGRVFLSQVRGHLHRCAMRRALRNQEPPFLPTARDGDIFGIPMLHSSLQRRLRGMGQSKARAEQWLKTIKNFQTKGLRAEELACANLISDLTLPIDDEVQFTATELADRCDFNDLRISVIPVVNNARQQLRFAQPTGRKLNRTQGLPKALAALPRSIVKFDPALGYRIEKVEHQSLWGAEQSWQAVTFSGKVVRNAVKQSGFQTVESAMSLANSHAQQHFPKRYALGRFSGYAWTGGADYREWLITLPHLPATYLSGHFRVRNVLAHIRCDVRLGAEDERVLMLQEVQSDWAQEARRATGAGAMMAGGEVPPPFMKEWPALVMKLVLLHAARQGLDAVAWTTGAQQVLRWNGLGATGLVELYDRTLPREVNRIVKPLGIACETLGVFVPTNFSIKRTENGYEVYSPKNELLGTAQTMEDAREFVPDQGQELLLDVHGVQLSNAVRQTILESGFPAWG